MFTVLPVISCRGRYDHVTFRPKKPVTKRCDQEEKPAPPVTTETDRKFLTIEKKGLVLIAAAQVYQQEVRTTGESRYDVVSAVPAGLPACLVSACLTTAALYSICHLINRHLLTGPMRILSRPPASGFFVYTSANYLE